MAKKRTLGDDLRDFKAGKISDKYYRYNPNRYVYNDSKINYKAIKNETDIIGNTAQDPVSYYNSHKKAISGNSTDNKNVFNSDSKVKGAFNEQIKRMENPQYGVQKRREEAIKKAEENIKRLDYVKTHDTVPTKEHQEQYQEDAALLNELDFQNKYQKVTTYEQAKTALSNAETTEEKNWLNNKAAELATSADLENEQKHLYDDFYNNGGGEKVVAGDIYAKDELNELDKKNEELQKLIETKKHEEKEKREYYDVIKNNPEYLDIMKKYYDLQKGEEISHMLGVTGHDIESIKIESSVDAYNYYKNLTYEEKEKIKDNFKSLPNNETLYKYYQRVRDESATEEEHELLKDYSTEHPVLGSLASVSLSAYGGIADSVNYISAGVDKAFGGDGYIDPQSTNVAKSQTIRETVSDDMNDAGEFFYGAGMSIADNIARMPVLLLPGGKVINRAMVATSAGTSYANQVLENGGDMDHALLTGAAAAAAETFFESISLKGLFNIVKKGKDSVIKSVSKQIAREGAEEVGTDIVDTVADSIINGDLSQLSLQYQNYINQGYSESEAWEKVYKDFAFQIGQDFAAGAISGGVLGGGAVAINKTTSMVYEGKNNFEIGAEALKSEDFNITDLIDSGKASSNKSTVKLAKSVESDFNKNGVAGVSKSDLGKLIKITTQKNSAQTTSVDTNSENTISQHDNTANSVNADNIIRNNNTFVSAANPQSNTNSSKVETVSRTVTNAFGNNHPNGLAAKTANNQRVTVVGIESSTRDYGSSDNTVTLRLDNGSLVNADDITTNLPYYNALFNYSKNFDTIGARAFVSQYETYAESKQSSGKSADVREYAAAYEQLYNLGKMGVEYESIKSSGRYNKALDTLGGIAYIAVKKGNDFTNNSMQNETENISKIRMPGQTNSINSKMYIEESAESSVKATDEQLQLLQAVAEKTGKDVILTDKLSDSENGVYANGKIYIRADLDSNYMLSTALHEAMHGVRQDSPNDYKVLRDFVTNYLVAKGENIDLMLDDIKLRWNDKVSTNEDLTEELVCQTVMTIATDETAIKTALSLEENKGILGKVANALRKIAKDAYNFMKGIGTTAHNMQAQTWLEDVNAINELADKLSEAFDNSRQIKMQLSDNAKSKQKNTANSGAKYSVGENADNSSVRNQARQNDSDINEQDIETLRTMGRKSINDFTSEDIQRTEKWARKFYEELGTKSPFFRAWFGDWRAYDSKKILVANDKGDTRGLQKNEDTGWQINVSRKVFNETVSHNGISNIKAKPYLPYINSIVKNAVLFDTFSMDNPKSKNSLFMHSFYAVANIGNGNEVLKLYVEEMNDPNSDNTLKRAYQLQNIEKWQPAVTGSVNKTLSRISQTANIDTVSDLFAVVKQYDKKFNPKSASKVVGKSGEPLVVYHQTKADFTIFNTNNERAGLYDSDTPTGMFFKTTDKNIGLAGNKQMAVYLNAKNVLTFNNRDDIHSYWMKNVSGYSELQKQYDDVDKKYQAEYEKEEIISDEWYEEHYDDLVSGKITDEEAQRIMNGKLDVILDEWKKATNPIRRKQKNLITEYIRKSDVDGIHLKNDEKVDTYIVFKPTQIKSATDNIGTFDKNNTDIRFAVDDTITQGYFVDDDLFNDLGVEETKFERAVKENPEYALNAVYNHAAKTAESAIKQTSDIRLDDKTYLSIAQRLMNRYNISRKFNKGFDEEFSETIKKHTEKIESGKYTDFAGELEDIVDECKDALLLSTKVNNDLLKEERNAIFDFLRGKTLVITDYAESDIRENYGSIANFRKRVFGRVNVALERNNPKGDIIYISDVIDAVENINASLITDESDSLQGYKWLDNLLNNVLVPKIYNPYIDGYYENIDTAAIEMAFDFTTEIIREKGKQAVADTKSERAVIRSISNNIKKALSEREAILKAKSESYKKSYELERTKRLEQIKQMQERFKNQYHRNSSEKSRYKKKIEQLQAALNDKTILLNMRYDTVRDQYNENRAKTVYRERLGRMLNRMSKRLDGKANNNEYIPQALKEPILNVLSSFTADPGNYKNGKAKPLPGYFGEWKNISEIGDRVNELTNVYSQLKPKDTKDKQYSYIDIESLAYKDATLETLQHLSDELKGKNIYELSASQLEMVYNTMSDLEETLRDSVQIIVDGQKISIKKAATQAISETESVHYKKNANISDSAFINMIASGGRELKNRVIATSLDPVRYGRFLSGYHDDYIVNKIFRGLHEGDMDRIKIQQEAFLKIQSVTSKYSNKELKDLQRADVKQFDFKDIKTGERVKISQGLLLAIELTNRQSDGRRHLVNDKFNHYTVLPDLDMVNLGRNNPDLHRVRLSKSDLTEISRYIKSNKMLNEIAGAVSEVYNVLLAQKINEVSMQKYGKLIATVQNYYPLKVYRDGANYEKNFEAEFNDIRLKNRGFTKVREKSFAPIVIDDVFRTFVRQVNSVSEYCGLMIPIENFKKVYNSNNGDVTLHEVIKEKFGPAAEHYIEKLMADLQNARDYLDINVLNKIQSNFMGAKLLLNPGAAVKQFGAYPMAYKYFGVKNVTKASVIGNKKVDLKHYSKYTPYLWYRQEGNSTVIGELSREAGLYKKAFDYYFDIMGKLDRIVVSSLLYAAELHVEQTTNLKNGTDEFYKEVVKQWEKCIDETQPSNMVTSKPQFVRNNIMRWLTLNAFKSQVMAMGNTVIDSFGEYHARRIDYKTNPNKQTKSDKNSAAKNLAASLIGVATSSMLTGALTVIANMIIWHKYDDFKDEEGNVTASSIASNFIDYTLESLSGCFVWGDKAYEVICAAIDKGVFFGFEAMSLENINDGIEKALKGDWLSLATLVTDCLGFPGENVVKIVRSVSSYANDIINGGGEIISKNNTFGFLGGNNTSNFNYIIVEAKQNGDTAKAEHFEEMWKDDLINNQGKTAEEANDFIKKKIIIALASSDDNIASAAVSKANGDLSGYEQNFDKVVSFGFDSVDVKKSVDKVIDNIIEDLTERNITDKEDIETELKGQGFNDLGVSYIFNKIEKETKQKSNNSDFGISVFEDTASSGDAVKYTYDDAFNALVQGDYENYQKIEDYLIDIGKKPSNIKSAMHSASRTDSLWEQYYDASNNNDTEAITRFQNMLTNIYGSWSTALSYGQKYLEKNS